MKGINFILLLVSLTTTVDIVSANEQWRWAKNIGKLGVRNYQSLEVLAPWGERGVVGAGTWMTDDSYKIEDINVPSSESMVGVFAFDDVGNIKWGSFLATGAREYNITVTSIQTDPEDNIYIAFSYLGLYCVIDKDTIYNLGSSDALVVKLNAQGKLLWHKRLATNGFDMVNALAVSADRHLYVTGGEVDNTNGNNKNSYLKKWDDKGIEKWSIDVTNPAPNFSTMATDELGNVYLSGYTGLPISINNVQLFNELSGASKMFILKFDPSGKLLKSTIVGDYTTSFCLHYANDKIYVASSLYVGNAYPSFSPGLKVERFSPDIVLEWAVISEYDSEAYSFAQPNGIAVDKNEIVSVIGNFSGDFKFGEYNISNPDRINFEPFYVNDNIFLTNINSDGQVLNLNRYGDKFSDSGSAITLLRDGRTAISGAFSSDQLLFGDYILENLSEIFVYSQHNIVIYFKSNLAYVAVFDLSQISNTLEQASIAQLQLHPNPSQDHFYIRSEAFTENPVQIQIFSTDGKLLSQQNLLPNGNSLRVETGTLPPGMYIANIIVDQQLSAQRFVKY